MRQGSPPFLLHREVQKLIRGWYKHAWSARDKPPQQCFEAFIFTYIAFNAWGSCVTGHDNDERIIKNLQSWDRLAEQFEHLLASDSVFLSHAEAFHDYWPIFKVQELRKLGIRKWGVPLAERKKFCEACIQAGAKQYAPSAGSQGLLGRDIPLSWANTLAALYRVRCNLFHGEKGLHMESDVTIVYHAYHILVRMMRPIIERDLTE